MNLKKVVWNLKEDQDIVFKKELKGSLEFEKACFFVESHLLYPSHFLAYLFAFSCLNVVLNT